MARRTPYNVQPVPVDPCARVKNRKSRPNRSFVSQHFGTDGFHEHI